MPESVEPTKYEHVTDEQLQQEIENTKARAEAYDFLARGFHRMVALPEYSHDEKQWRYGKYRAYEALREQCQQLLTKLEGIQAARMIGSTKERNQRDYQGLEELVNPRLTTTSAGHVVRNPGYLLHDPVAGVKAIKDKVRSLAAGAGFDPSLTIIINEDGGISPQYTLGKSVFVLHPKAVSYWEGKVRILIPEMIYRVTEDGVAQCNAYTAQGFLSSIGALVNA